MRLKVHLQLLTPVWHNLSMFWGRTNCIRLFVPTGQYLVRRKQNQKLNRKGQYLVRRKRNRKLNRKRKRTRNRNRNRKRKRTRNRQSTSIYATLAWARVYICSYALSSPSICSYTCWTYGFSFTSQHIFICCVIYLKVWWHGEKCTENWLVPWNDMWFRTACPVQQNNDCVMFSCILWCKNIMN